MQTQFILVLSHLKPMSSPQVNCSKTTEIREVSLLLIDYKHLVINYKIQNSNFKALLKILFEILSLVIDYNA